MYANQMKLTTNYPLSGISNKTKTSLCEIKKVPRGIRGEKSSKDMASSRNLVSKIGAQASPKMGNGTRCPERVYEMQTFAIFLKGIIFLLPLTLFMKYIFSTKLQSTVNSLELSYKLCENVFFYLKQRRVVG